MECRSVEDKDKTIAELRAQVRLLMQEIARLKAKLLSTWGDA